ncbi:MAG: cytochrome c-type biogenesis protein CcmH, partial [Paracoccaceae bacterium]|nr:cytochrome c-type biogenesis protein CcmH [Paracoccaceae bacterium]
MNQVFSALLLSILALPVVAVEPAEILSDPALEQRARAISQTLRCLVCRNESIDESNADLARDLRLLVRARIEAGNSDSAVIEFVVERYGEYVLFTPEKNGANWLLWAAGPLSLVFAGGVIVS